MSREWKPGDVAIDKRGRRIFRHGDKWIRQEPGFHAAKIASGWDTDDARPLVVIDPEDHEQVERLDHALQKVSGEATFSATSRFLQDALREFANPTPPKPEEPKGLGAVVEDAEGCYFVRTNVGGWEWHEVGGSPTTWNLIHAVRVLSEGVQA